MKYENQCPEVIIWNKYPEVKPPELNNAILLHRRSEEDDYIDYDYYLEGITDTSDLIAWSHIPSGWVEK